MLLAARARAHARTGGFAGAVRAGPFRLSESPYAVCGEPGWRGRRRAQPSADGRRREERAALISGDPLVICGQGSRIVAWSPAAEDLTGLPAAEAVGMRCWDALDGVDGAGAPVCRAGCAYSRRALEGRPLPAHELHVRRAGGVRVRVRASMISLPEAQGGGYAIVLQDQHDAAPPADPGGLRLTPRQREVLGLLAEGMPVRAVAGRLGLSESTVRNYVRRILIALGCHSQLEAVAVARRAGLL